jgi:hypothetical protein
MRKWCIHEQKVCSFSNITSHQNRLLLFVKHNTEHSVASTDPETLRKVARNTVKMADASFPEVCAHFQHLL